MEPKMAKQPLTLVRLSSYSNISRQDFKKLQEEVSELNNGFNQQRIESTDVPDQYRCDLLCAKQLI